MGRFLSHFRSARLIGSGGNSPSSRFNWCKVWYSFGKFLRENLKIFHPTSLHDAALEGSTIFLRRSSTSRMPLESSRLPELKYAFFSRKGRNTKKLQRLNIFSINDLSAWAPRGINISISIHLHKLYKVGKLSIRRVKICNFSRIRRKTEEWEPSKGQKMTFYDRRTWSL